MSQDEEVFEIVDFTSASEWEIFTSKLEEILLSWQLSLKDKEEITLVPVRINGEWKSQSEDINFAGYPFIVTHHWTTAGDFVEDPVQKSDDTISNQVNKGSQVFQALMDAESDFNLWTNCHSLSKSYGLGEFVIISPSGNEMLTTESRINLVFSSISMAINNIQCRVPIFLQVHSKSQQLYQGAFEEKNLFVDFQMVHLKRIPPQCHHLSGLLDIFKEKIGSPSMECVDVSVSWTFSVSGMTSIDAHENWPQSPPSLDNTEIIEVFPLGKLGFGASKDPIKEIQVSSIWQSLNEDVVVDSEVYTDLDPVQAPLWTVHLELNDQVGSMLIKSLCTILDHCRSAATTEQLLGKNYTVLQSPDSPEYELALGALTKERGGYSLISSKRLFSGSNKPTKTGGPIPEKTLVVLLNFLFPDAEGDVSKQTHPYPEQFPLDFPTTFSDNSSWKDLLQSLKSCPVESLVWRLAMVIVYTVVHLNGLESLAHLWHEIVLEFRYRWENGYAIPGLESGTPDLNYCLFYQKLQMLNCSINHKKNIESGPPPDATSGEEDEFFDATETAAVEEEVPLKQHSVWNQPQGRKERTKMKLLRSGEFLYNPITQEGCPMTEDMIIEMTEMMEQLGEDAEGSELRARILSASLLSDMESFKAANPGAEIEDFVRWHSPRDWIDEEPLTLSDGAKMEFGHLSARMRAPGNLWQEMWNVAKPITAFRQKKLFDSTKEAEKILHCFSSMKVSQVLSMLLPSIFHASVCRLLEESASTTLPETVGTCRKIVSRIAQIFRNSPLDLYQYEDLLSSIQQVEVRVSQFNSLRRKMSNGSKDMDAFISNLMMDGNLSLPGGSHTEIGTILLRALEKSKGENTTSRLPPPIKKEFILRTKARRKGSGSTSSCQRMYCCVDHDSFRLAGAFTQDTMFY